MITPAYAPTASERVLPRLALDFTTAVLDPRVTVARALNTATRINSSGLVEIVNADLPRFDYTLNTGGACKGLLIEETRPNLLLQSAAFNEAVWLKSASGTGVLPAVTPDYGISPDGTQNADRIILDAGAAGSSQISQNPVGNVATPHTYSIFLKSLAGNVTVTLFALADVKNVTVTSTWQRFDFVRSISASTPAEVRIAKRDVWGSAGVADLLVYGAQLETGAFATSYIPTTTTSLTRNADVVSMTGANFSDWYNQSEGTFVGEFTTYPVVGSGKYAYGISDGSTTNFIAQRQDSARVQTLGSTVAAMNSATVLPNTTYKSVIAYKTDSFAADANAQLLYTDTSGAVPTVNQLMLGDLEPSTNRRINCWMRKFNFYPQRLINPEVTAFSK